MTPEREAQMREMFGLTFGPRPEDQKYQQNWDDHFSTWLACARALEPMARDAERFEWMAKNWAIRPDETGLSYGEPLRDVIDAAMSSALEDGNADV